MIRKVFKRTCPEYTSSVTSLTRATSKRPSTCREKLCRCWLRSCDRNLRQTSECSNVEICRAWLDCGKRAGLICESLRKEPEMGRSIVAVIVGYIAMFVLVF